MHGTGVSRSETDQMTKAGGALGLCGDADRSGHGGPVALTTPWGTTLMKWTSQLYS
jgi:hypothetical protein